MYSRLNRWLADGFASLAKITKSRRFFWFVITIFGSESAWIALSAVYPMAFDEDFHFGVIQFYAHHLSPFITNQPADTYSLGALARDPSYLYHYLMSFPYRLISLFTSSTTSQIIALRFINIGIFGAVLYTFKRLFTKFSTLSSGLINLVLLFFVLLPVVPQMAGQINYDSLFCLAIALSLYAYLDFSQTLRVTGQIDVKKGLLLLSSCLLGSLVKYAFLPIFVVLAVATIFILVKRPGGLKNLWHNAHASFFKLSRVARLGLLGFAFISLGLFGQRYGVNLVRYHVPVPECDQVLNVTDCQQYSPWLRNYQMSLSKTGDTDVAIVSYTNYWFNHALFGLTFAGNGRTSGYGYGAPFPVITIVIRGLFMGGITAIIVFGWRRLWPNPINRLLLAITLFYLVILWVQNIYDYSRLGWPVAVQGRYWIPVMIPLLIMFGQLITGLVKKYQLARIAVMVIFVAFVVQGSGATTFIMRSDSTWYWPNSAITKINQTSRNFLRHVVID